MLLSTQDKVCTSAQKYAGCVLGKALNDPALLFKHLDSTHIIRHPCLRICIWRECGFLISIIVIIQILLHFLQIRRFHSHLLCQQTDDLTVIDTAVQFFCNFLSDFSSAAAIDTANGYIDLILRVCCHRNFFRFTLSFPGNQFPHHLVIHFIQLVTCCNDKHDHPDRNGHIQIKSLDRRDRRCCLLCRCCFQSVECCHGKNRTHDSGCKA